MIVTVTANPALDRTVTITEPLQRGQVQRATAVQQQAGGKGVNVTRALLASAVESIAIVPAAADDPFIAAARAGGIPVRAVPITGNVRTNIAVTEADGTTTKINEPGPKMTDEEFAALREAILGEIRSGQASTVVLAGSLPASLGAGGYVRIVRSLRETLGESAPFLVADSSGEPMRELVGSGEAIDLVKPNAHELAELTGSDGDAMEAEPRLALDAARHLIATTGIRAALVTLGAAGALHVTAEEAIFARAPRIRAVSTVGAGDASLAGYLLARERGQSPRDALRQAAAHGAAAASLPGSTMPAPGQADPGAISTEMWSRPGDPE